jgi:hypothetical protein
MFIFEQKSKSGLQIYVEVHRLYKLKGDLLLSGRILVQAPQFSISLSLIKVRGNDKK